MHRQTQTGARGSNGPAVVYFAKAPVPGSVKTRLTPPLTPAEAAALYGAWLGGLQAVAGARTLVYGWPPGSMALLRAALPRGLELRSQRGDDLWQRMARCFDELFDEGHAPVVIRNTDSPDLPQLRVREALERSRPGTVVLGPDTGGGYYLVGLAERCPDLLGGIEVGTGQVFAQTVARAQSLGLTVEALAIERDIDVFDDLLAVWRARGGTGRGTA